MKYFVLFVFLYACLTCDGRNPLEEPTGVVPDSGTALKLAEIIGMRLYGENSVKGERPYDVKLIEGVWQITGTLRKGIR
jgi:hypothetical protein